MEDSEHGKVIKIGKRKITIGKKAKATPYKNPEKKEEKEPKKNDSNSSEARSRPGESNVGKYTHVSKKNFAGPSGGAPKGSYPINTEKRAKAALAYAHNAPNPSGIKKAVYRKYPSLGKNKKG